MGLFKMPRSKDSRMQKEVKTPLLHRECRLGIDAPHRSLYIFVMATTASEKIDRRNLIDLIVLLHQLSTAQTWRKMTRTSGKMQKEPYNAAVLMYRLPYVPYSPNIPVHTPDALLLYGRHLEQSDLPFLLMCDRNANCDDGWRSRAPYRC